VVLLPVFSDGSGNSNHEVTSRFSHFGRFLSLIELMVQFIRMIDRVLSPYALLTNVFISCHLFATLVSVALILWVIVIAMDSRGSRD
jgi:hypothetical protein